MNITDFKRAAFIALVGFPAAIAQSTSAAPTLTFVPNSTVKLYQVTGDCDWVQWDATLTAKTPTCVPTASKTLTNADIVGDDVPGVFENNGEMVITFGDTIGAAEAAQYTTIQNSFVWGAHDPIGHSTTVNASDGILINFYPSGGNHALEVLPPPQPNGTAVAMGTDDTPRSGISVNGTIYVGIRTGNIANGGGNNDHTMEYSVLTTFNESTLAFTSGRTISALPSGLFVDPTFYLAQPGQLGSPSPVSPEPAVLNFGLGEPGTSNVYLSAISNSYFWTGTDSSGNPATRYFAGLSNGQPIWSVNESDSVPIVNDINPAKPTIERATVTYSQPLGLWLMVFKKNGGQYFTYSQTPWGPWSTPQLIMNDCRDKAFGTFMYYYDTGANTCAGLASPAGPMGPTISPTVNVPATTPGHSYSPEIVGRFTIISGNTLKLFYMVSTWNPYATVMMESDFTIATPAAPAILAGGVVPIYSKSTTIEPGSWSSIYGSNLATTTAVWTGNFPTNLGNTTVTIDGKPAYLWFVSAGQINFQPPDDTATGPVKVVVTTPAGTATSTVTLGQFAPNLLVLGDGVHVTAIVLTPGLPGNSGAGYDVIGPTRPVKAGETLVVYGGGFGPTQTVVPAGQPYASATKTTNPVSVTIGGVAVPQASVLFSGIVGAGLYQLNIVVPPNLGTGDKSIFASVGGFQTQSGVMLSLQ